MESRSTLVRSRTSASWTSGFTRTSMRPSDSRRPSSGSSAGLATSPSTRRTRLSSSIAMLIARLAAVKVFPSPGNALAIMIMLPRSTRTADLPSAFARSGRLITRNSSSCERGASGVITPALAIFARSIVTRRDLRSASGAGGGAGGSTAGFLLAPARGSSSFSSALPTARHGIRRKDQFERSARVAGVAECSSRWAACSIRLTACSLGHRRPHGEPGDADTVDRNQGGNATRKAVAR